VRTRSVLAAGLLAGALALVSIDARAEEPAQARVAARHAIVAGDLKRARAILAEATASPDAGAAERAAVAELSYVIETWSHLGRPPAATSANDAPIPDDEEDFEHAFARARSMLLGGHYAEAARRFDTLVGTAPDLVAGARAAELRALAREAAPAVAPAPPPPPARGAEESVQTEPRWYGWQTLIVDATSIVMTPIVPALGVTGYFLGGPIVHVAHWHGLHMLASLGVRVGAPTVGLFVGLAAANGCTGDDFCELEGAAIGALIGIGVAIAVDAAVIARDEVPVEKKTAIVPFLAPGRAGIGGTF